MRDRQTCIDCGKKSPETETNYTLISAQFGWRLSRRRADNGDFVVEWRCPECWRSHKKKPHDEPASNASGKTLPERSAPSASRLAKETPAAARDSSRPPRPSSKPPPSSVPTSTVPRTRRP